MPFNPTLPVANSAITSAELRNQFTGLKALIDVPETDPVYLAEKGAANGVATLDGSGVLPAPQVPPNLALDGITRGDTTPAIDVLNSRLIAGNGTFIAADWSTGSVGVGFLGALAPATEIGLQCDLNFGGNHIYGDTGNNDRSLCINPGGRLLVAPDGVTVVASWTDGTLRDGAGSAFSTGAYSPANPGHWAGSPPATVAEALDRLAAAVSNAGANPIPV